MRPFRQQGGGGFKTSNQVGFNVRQDSEVDTSKTVINRYQENGGGFKYNQNAFTNVRKEAERGENQNNYEVEQNRFTNIRKEIQRGGGGRVDIINQNGFEIEQHGSESSLYRVFLQQYNGGGQCGVFNVSILNIMFDILG